LSGGRAFGEFEAGSEIELARSERRKLGDVDNRAWYPEIRQGVAWLASARRTLIVDSEAPARELLHDMLAPHRNVRVVGEANSCPTAVSLYEDLHLNLVFMDVQMPKGDGFSLLPKVAVEVEAFKEPLALGRRGSFRLRRALRESRVL
jgi:hypothetical protein